VTIPNPEHLLEQAEKLVGPRQADIRRAISSAYYALFHAASINAADAVAGAGNRNSERYALIYRSINHASLVTVCEAIAKDRAGLRPEGGFSADFKRFAEALSDLQRNRHSADYDPLARFSRTDAVWTIRAARTAFTQFKAATDEERLIFGSLLLFPRRRA
jgi:uncharacterized protein (UPF0332 family)